MALLRTKNLQLPDPADTPAAAAEVVRVTVPAVHRESDGQDWGKPTRHTVILDYRVEDRLRARYDLEAGKTGYDWDVAAAARLAAMRALHAEQRLAPGNAIPGSANWTTPASMVRLTYFDSEGNYTGRAGVGEVYGVNPFELPLKWHKHVHALGLAIQYVNSAERSARDAAAAKARYDAQIEAADPALFQPNHRERLTAKWIMHLIETGGRP